MRKHILLTILLSCLHIAARGQTITSLDDIDLSGLPQPTQAKALRYWFDDDNGNLTTVSQLSGGQTLDVSSLIDGLHTLHYQVIDENDAVADVRSDLFLKTNGQAGVIQASRLRYWFDDDATSMKTVTAMNGTQTVDASQLLDGLHTIHYKAVGNDGAVYDIASGIFMKMEESASGQVTAKKLMYWFDDEADVLNVDMTGGVQMLDASHLIDGLHTIHHQVLCSNGQMTPVHSSIFMRTSGNEEVAVAQKLRYWFDDAQTATETDITSGIQLLDASSLIDGLHTIHYQVKDSKGMLGSPASSVFMKMDTSSTTASSLRYWFDDDVSSLQVVNVGQGTQTLDVSGLLTGLHTLTYQLIDDKGKVSTPVSRLFMKNFDRQIAEGENRITKYQYWLNKNSAAIQTVTLDNAANPFSLISLLPVQSEPIHSDCFHFEITDGQPMVYAKNVFHIRFHDATDYFSDDFRTYIDYNAKQTITDFEILEHGVPATTAKPTDNHIKWYKVEALRGDSLAFKTHQACTLQLFSPSGKELYSASSPEVLRYGGAYAPEDGTYYIAVHDGKSQYDNNVTVEFQHIGKYVVLNYTPKEAGVAAGYLNMELDGNGYDKLQSVVLVNGETELNPSKVTVNSKSSAVLQFTLYGDEPIGDYDLVLDFDDEEGTKTLTISSAIKFTTADFGDFAITIEPTRRAGFPYPVIVKVKNTGNVSKLYTPFNLAASLNLGERNALEDPSACSWTSMYTMNFDVLFDSEKSVEEGGYSPYTLTDDMIGTGLPGVVLHGFIPEIGPNETKEYILGFVGGAHARFNLYAWTGKPLNEDFESNTTGTNIYSVWDYLAELEQYNASSEPRNSIRKAPNFDNVNRAFTVTDQINGRASQAARNSVGIGAAIGGIVNGLRMRNIDAYSDDPFARDVLSDYRASVRNSMPTPAQIGDLAGIPGWLQGLLGLQGGQSRCGTPTGHAAPIDIYAPGDPNDIFGYASESGSKYIKEDITDVYYTIEFENDPEIANASAHTIVVKDTLDTSRFDLSTFAAKSVKIGDKVMELDGEKSFSKRTMDLRPEINVVAQVSLSLDENSGIATWTIESLDPMSMDPTEDVMQGVLPVNVNGNGQGFLTFDIKLKSSLTHGTNINNRAGIVFDTNDVIMTPTWTNTIDGIAPESRVTSVEELDESTAKVNISATDELSGPWRYDVYVQYGTDSEWTKAAMNVPIDSIARVKIYHGMNHGFYVVVTDSAGNVEQKQAAREFELVLGDVIAGDANSDGKVSISDAVTIVNHLLGNDLLGFSSAAADINHDGEVTISDAVDIVNMILGNNSPLNSRRKEQDP